MNRVGICYKKDKPKVRHMIERIWWKFENCLDQYNSIHTYFINPYGHKIARKRRSGTKQCQIVEQRRKIICANRNEVEWKRANVQKQVAHQLQKSKASIPTLQTDKHTTARLGAQEMKTESRLTVWKLVCNWCKRTESWHNCWPIVGKEKYIILHNVASLKN